MVIASRNVQALKAATDRLRGAVPGANVTYLSCDIRAEDDVKRLFRTVYERHGKLDFLVRPRHILTLRSETCTLAERVPPSNDSVPSCFVRLA